MGAIGKTVARSAAQTGVIESCQNGISPGTVPDRRRHRRRICRTPRFPENGGLSEEETPLEGCFRENREKDNM